MRIAIFDGILEHHLHESLERALVARGHAVHTTGKIGHGFRFPAPHTNVSHLDRAVAETIAHEPDWVIVMRPASLPPRMLQRLRDAGARLTAWFSDDPVLFDLSYAPVVDQYDRILHCGSTAVLEHYERFFGRPTGVNLPFWTDHEAFPAVWGEEPAESRAMFLGNVHDEVRRRRYFELARFGDDIRIHGKVGSDYARRAAGYLDTDAEVIAAGARTDWAINIPQRFADHRGLETWFPGLDELGHFEYPSRVVQTMAMGIPTISIVAGRPRFETYPEMLVASSVDEAIDIVRDPSWDAVRLAEQSSAVLRRFDRHFSASSRAIAIERFLLDDDWMALDATARTRWFADVVDATLARDSVSTASARAEARPARPGAIVGQPHPVPERAVVVTPSGAGPVSRSTAVVEALQELGVAVQSVPAASAPLDPLEVGRQVVPGSTSCVIVVDLPELPAPAGGDRAILIADLDAPTRASAAVVASYDLVALTSQAAVEKFRDAGFRHVVSLPRLITPTFARAIEAQRARASGTAVRIAVDAAAERTSVPGLDGVLEAAAIPLQTWEALAALAPAELAAAVTADAGVIVPRGPRGNPQLDDLFVHVRAAVGRALMPRTAALSHWPALADATTQFASTSELGRKAWRLETSRRAGRSIDAAHAALRQATDAVRAVDELLRAPLVGPLPGLRLASSGELLERGASCEISFDELGWRPQSIVRLGVGPRSYAPTSAGLVASILFDGEPVWSSSMAGATRLAVAAPHSARHRLRVRFEYRGALQGITPEAAFELDARVVEDTLPVPMHATGVRVLELR
ncbi:hypothetical protein AA0Z99_08485 [Agrococcus sp. 1P02AA]|uniref:hypothetical protein n=1 Tax=Agrococcus sp. 1P02AA TaxID=3132259 RepID=UPI0039A41CA2